MAKKPITERERREQGLLPSPAMQAWYASMQKKAEEQAAHIAETLAPTMESYSQLVAAIQWPGQAMTEVIERASKVARFSVLPSSEVIIPMPIRDYGPRTVRLDQEQFDELAKGSVSRESSRDALYMDLVFEPIIKELFRMVYGTRYASSFKDTEDNKRLLLLEKLLKSRKPVPTRDIAEYLDCSQKQVQNLVQAVNAKLENDLRLPQSLIVANRGSGYYINRFYCVFGIA